MCKANILLFIIGIIVIYYLYKISFVENFNNDIRTYSSDGDLGKTFNDILDTYKFTKVKKDGMWFFPSDYNPCEKQAKELIASDSAKYIYVMDGCDIIGSKIDLWKVLRAYYGIPIAESYLPMTYLYDNPDDMNMLKNKLTNATSTTAKMFILKNYNQRQEGIKIVTTWDEINSDENKKRKTNIRVYYLVVCRNNSVEGYVYNNGFMYYTPYFYDPDSTDFEKHITTGYIDRQVYIDNPLTIQDLYKYLGVDKSKILEDNICKAMKHVTMALSKNVCTNNANDKVKFQVYGVDIAPLSDLSVKLMEINKGPDLNEKDERDGVVKKSMQSDIFKIIDPFISADKSNGFIQVFGPTFNQTDTIEGYIKTNMTLNLL